MEYVLINKRTFMNIKMRTFNLIAAALLASSSASAQTLPESPSLPAVVEHPDPLKVLQRVTAQTFDAFYKDMVKASTDFGAEPTYECHNSEDGLRYCGTYTLFHRDGGVASVSDFVWQQNGKHQQSVCLFLKLNEPNKACLRSDGHLWAYDGKSISKFYRNKW
jgi:hypothetical protein